MDTIEKDTSQRLKTSNKNC